MFCRINMLSQLSYEIRAILEQCRSLMEIFQKYKNIYLKYRNTICFRGAAKQRDTNVTQYQRLYSFHEYFRDSTFLTLLNISLISFLLLFLHPVSNIIAHNYNNSTNFRHN